MPIPATPSHSHSLSRSILAGLVCLTTSGCQDASRLVKQVLGVQDDAPLDVEAPRPSNLPDVGGDAQPPAPRTTFTREPLERAIKKFPLLAKGAPGLGFKLTALDRLHALEIAPEVAPWGSLDADDPSMVIDGDLDSAWTCTPGELQACALGVHFTGVAKVKAIRIFAAGGTRRADQERHPRPKLIRVHTAEGFADARFPDGQDFIYVILGREAETANLTIEFVESWAGAVDELRVGEVTVYGDVPEGGPELDLDPLRTFVSWEDGPWRQVDHKWRPTTSFIRSVGPDGATSSIALGSALRGQAGDRLLLLERLQDSTCTRTEGTVHLVDQHTEVLAPLGELGGVGGDLFRHRDGTGLALGFTDEFSTTLAGVVVDAERGYVVKRTPLRQDKRKVDTFYDWGFEPLVIARTGTPLGAATTGCTKANDEQLQALATAVTASKTAPRGFDPAASADDWSACSVGTLTAYLSDGGTCGDGWQIHVLDDEGALRGNAHQRHPGSHLRLRRLDDDELWVEATGTDDSGSVFRITAEGLATLAEEGAFALPPPGACRPECGDGFVNPGAPSW